MKMLSTLTAVLVFSFCAGFLPPAAQSDQNQEGETVYWARFFPNTGSFSFARARLKKRSAKAEAAEDTPAKSIQARHVYQALLADLNRIITIGGSRLRTGSDHMDVFIFWQLGQRITVEMENASDDLKPVAEFLELLAKDLGFEKQTLAEILLFYKQYAVISTVSPRLGWPHYQILIRVRNEEKRRYYQTMAVQQGWDAEELQRQVMQKDPAEGPP